jgi:hypothetical protein
MNEPENNLNPSVGGNDELESLRRQVTLLFGALVISSVTLTAYLGLQARRASVELVAVQPRSEEAIKMLQQDNAGVQAAYGKLLEFGRTHPDFQKQVLSKYKVTSNAPPASVSK